MEIEYIIWKVKASLLQLWKGLVGHEHNGDHLDDGHGPCASWWPLWSRPLCQLVTFMVTALVPVGDNYNYNYNFNFSCQLKLQLQQSSGLYCVGAWWRDNRIVCHLIILKYNFQGKASRRGEDWKRKWEQLGGVYELGGEVELWGRAAGQWRRKRGELAAYHQYSTINAAHMVNEEGKFSLWREAWV